MKNLANCKPTEFLVQSNKIRKSVQKWLTVTDISGIRKRMPVLTDATEEERKKALEEQAIENFNAILDAILDDHPMETLELLALLCFVEPEHVDDHTVEEYLESIHELITNETVLNFFTSLTNLERLIT